MHSTSLPRKRRNDLHQSPKCRVIVMKQSSFTDSALVVGDDEQYWRPCWRLVVIIPAQAFSETISSTTRYCDMWHWSPVHGGRLVSRRNRTERSCPLQ